MDKSSKIIALCSCCFVILFLMSVFMPDQRMEEKQDRSFIAQESQNNQTSDPALNMEQQIRQQQQQNYRSFQQDESNYYKNVTPQNNEQPHYFDEDHPLQESPLDSDPVE